MNPDLDWHRHRAASKRRVRVRFEAHLFVPGFLSVGNYNTTLSSDSLETGTGSSNSLCSTIQSSKLDWLRAKSPFRLRLLTALSSYSLTRPRTCSPTSTNSISQVVSVLQATASVCKRPALACILLAPTDARTSNSTSASRRAGCAIPMSAKSSSGRGSCTRQARNPRGLAARDGPRRGRHRPSPGRRRRPARR